jgi:hypothetical protein
MMKTKNIGNKRRHLVMMLIGLVGWMGSLMAQQQQTATMTVRNGKMYIGVGKGIQPPALDSFIRKYDLSELALRDFIWKGIGDSLRKQGWAIEVENDFVIIISKSLQALDEINDPARRIMMSGGESNDLKFPAIRNIRIGYNRTRNRGDFIIKDSMVMFFLPGHGNAGKVMLAGSFNNWSPEDIPMKRTDNGWIAGVKLIPGKHWYKFVVDGEWITDPENRNNENDGRGNTNSVYYYANTVFRLAGYRDSKKVFISGSFNNWKEKEIEMQRTPTGWELPVYLADGTHTYRYIADGTWLTDPANPEKFPNEFNEFNSVVHIGKPYHFKLEGFTNAKNVILSGSFNGWRDNELFMKKTATGWVFDYVLTPGNHEYHFIVDGKQMYDPANPPLAQASNKKNSMLLLNANHVFRLKGFSNAKNVFLAGDFNNWDRGSMPMKKENGDWVFNVHLSPGKHLYKFIVDGEWINDPNNPLWEQNEHNTGNSVIWIGQ